MQTNPRKLWTLEKCKESALKFKTRNEWRKNEKTCYQAAQRYNWAEECTAHMEPKKSNDLGFWTLERCKESALKYKSKSEWKRCEPGAYGKAIVKKWLDICCDQMEEIFKPNGYWNFDRCKEEALKYNKRENFKKKSTSAYNAAMRKGWLKSIMSHMPKKDTFPSGYWTKERCHEIALKWQTRKEFELDCIGAYQAARRNRWLKDICSHMIRVGNKVRRCIYVYEFPDNHAYVGLTYDIRKRKKNRETSPRDNVTKYIKKTGLTPEIKILTDFIPVEEAAQMEIKTIQEYRDNGWIMINVKVGGDTGSKKMIYTKEFCIEQANKYTNIKDFRTKSRPAYDSCVRHKWLDDIYSLMGVKRFKQSGYWSFEKCRDVALKYSSINEFMQKDINVYNYSRRKGFLTEICQHMTRLIYPNNYWTKDRCKEALLKCKNRAEFKRKFPGANRACKRNNWDDVLDLKPSVYDIPKFTKEECFLIASKCKMRSDFMRLNEPAYRFSLKNGYLNEFFPKTI